MSKRDDKDKIAVSILLIALDEQRRFHDEVTRSFESIRNKIVYYIGAILATLTFLYSGALDNSKTTRQKLFIPTELYGVIFYFFGLACVIFALFALFKGMRPDIRWNVYTETNERKVIGCVNRDMTECEYLQELVNGYQDHTNKNLVSHEKKSKASKESFFPMIIGVTILVVLRFFQ